MSKLYILSGLPGSGKSTLAKRLCAETGSAYLRIDTIEQALRNYLKIDVEGEGYRIAYEIAEDNLYNGIDVVADSCNPIELTRNEWQQVAVNASAEFINIEIVCSSANEHKERVESRSTDIKGLSLPSWKQVMEREYHSWSNERIIIDTANKSIDESIGELLRKIPEEL